MENLVNLLNNEEIEMMNSYRNYYAAYNDYSKTHPVSMKDILSSYWGVEKQNLYKMLGEKLIIAKDIVAEKSDYELEELANSKIFNYNSKSKVFVDDLCELIYTNYAKYDYDESNPNFQMYHNIDKLFVIKYLISNVYDGATFYVDFPNGDKYKVQKGCKVSKALGKIAEGFNLRGYEEFRLDHSLVLNEKKLSGRMHLSIHPMDFMTMSDNECGWSSCMSWREEGEYRRGTVEMMNSPVIVEAYLDSEEKIGFDDYTWNSKKWRQLFIVSPDCICGIKGYPYWNRALEKIALDWIKELATANLGYEYYDTLYNLNGQRDAVSINGVNCFFEFSTDAMYNDCYDKHYGYARVGIDTDSMGHNVYINYSGASQCMWCGSVHNYFNDEGCLVCENCGGDCVYCYDCGERVSSDDVYEVNGHYYCEYCYDNLPRCMDCESLIENGEEYRIYLKVKDKIIKNCYGTFCYDCRYENCSDHFESKNVHEYTIDDYRHIAYIDINDLDCDKWYLSNVFGYSKGDENALESWLLPEKEESPEVVQNIA